MYGDRYIFKCTRIQPTYILPLLIIKKAVALLTIKKANKYEGFSAECYIQLRRAILITSMRTVKKLFPKS